MSCGEPSWLLFRFRPNVNIRVLSRSGSDLRHVVQNLQKYKESSRK